MRRFAVTLVLALLGLGLGTGCRTTVVYQDSRVTVANTNRVMVEDVAIGTTGASMKAQAHLRNLTDKQLRLRLRFTWLDAQGQAVGVGSPTDGWIKTSLAPKERRAVDAVAPNADCVDVRVYVQEWSK